MPPKFAKRHWFQKPIPIIAIVALLGFGVWFSMGESGLWPSYRLNRTRAAQAAQIRQLEAKKKQLADYLAALKAGDDVALERAARERNLAAPNETIYEIKVEPPKR